MRLIISGNISHTLTKIMPRVEQINHCRLKGRFKDGKSFRICPLRQAKMMMRSTNITGYEIHNVAGYDPNRIEEIHQEARARLSMVP